MMIISNNDENDFFFVFKVIRKEENTNKKPRNILRYVESRLLAKHYYRYSIGNWNGRRREAVVMCVYFYFDVNIIYHLSSNLCCPLAMRNDVL